METPNNIIAELPPVDPSSGDNWAYLATDAWILEATKAGHKVTEVSWDEKAWVVDHTCDAGLVEIGGLVYVLTVDHDKTIRAYVADPILEDE